MRGDKGKTVVIIGNVKLTRKSDGFNKENNLKHKRKDPTTKYQREVRHIIKKCNTVIDKTDQYKHVQIKPEALTLNALTKLHKETQPIRPTVIHRGATTYKIAEFMATRLKQILNLSYYTTNTLQLQKS
jgi:hypothetical protein